MAEFPFQLVIQFVALDDDATAFEKTLAVEEDLIKRLDPSVALVDGHDVGSGEMNIFVLTDDPGGTLAAITPVLLEHSMLQPSKIAYRALDEDDYVCL